MKKESFIDWELHLNKLLDDQIPSRQCIRTLCQKASDIHLKEKNIIKLKGSFYVIGDIHGYLSIFYIFLYFYFFK